MFTQYAGAAHTEPLRTLRATHQTSHEGVVGLEHHHDRPEHPVKWHVNVDEELQSVDGVVGWVVDVEVDE